MPDFIRRFLELVGDALGVASLLFLVWVFLMAAHALGG